VTASVFLSYASEDREAARSIGDALTSFGLDVWLDQSELGGGDAWDQKIRKQIRECDYFMPIISIAHRGAPRGLFPSGMALGGRAHARYGGRSPVSTSGRHRRYQ
jgi:hypothetical protein